MTGFLDGARKAVPLLVLLAILVVAGYRPIHFSQDPIDFSRDQLLVFCRQDVFRNHFTDHFLCRVRVNYGYETVLLKSNLTERCSRPFETTCRASCFLSMIASKTTSGSIMRKGWPTIWIADNRLCSFPIQLLIKSKTSASVTRARHSGLSPFVMS